MRQLKLALIVLFWALLALAVPAFADSGSVVQETATSPRAATVCQEAGSPQVNTQNTLTFAVPAGQYLYLQSVYFNVIADGTGGTTLAIGRFTTTNMQSMEWATSFAGTANTAASAISQGWPLGVKSALGPLNVTFVSPAGGTHNAYPMTACGYYAQ